MTKKELEETISSLNRRISKLEDRLDASQVFHPNFWTRAMAIVGHNVAFWGALWVVIAAIAFLADS